MRVITELTRRPHIPTYDGGHIEVAIVHTDETDILMTRVRIVGERGGIRGEALLAAFGAEKLSNVTEHAARETS